MNPPPGRRPTVTVILVDPESDPGLAATLDSVLNQSFGDIEVIVVRGSASAEASPAITLDDRRIRHVHPTASTRAECQNHGIQLAQGRFIAFIQAGDRWFKEKLQCHVGQLDQDPRLGVVYAYTQLENSDGTPFGLLRDEGRPRTDFCDLFAHDVIAHGSNAVVRAQVFTGRGRQMPHYPALQGFDPQLGDAADYELWCRIALTSRWRFACTPKVLNRHRLRPLDPQRGFRPQLHAHLFALIKIAALAPATVERHRHRAVAQFFWQRALRLAAHREIEAARRAIATARDFDRTSLTLNHALLTAGVITLRRLGPKSRPLVRSAARLWHRWQRQRIAKSGPASGQRRQRLVHAVHTRCRTGPASINYARPGALGNLFTICHRHRAMFVNISKNASSSLKHTFYREEFCDLTHVGQGIHARWGFEPSPGRLVEVRDTQGLAPYRGYLRFAVYRDPVARLLSAYYNKVVYPPDDHFYYVTRRLYGAGLDKFIDVAAQVVQLDDPLEMDEHLRPQSQFYTPEDVDYIVAIEHLEPFLQAKFGIPPAPRHNRVSGPKLQPTAEQTARIRQIYARDYEIRPNWPEDKGCWH